MCPRLGRIHSELAGAVRQVGGGYLLICWTNMDVGLRTLVLGSDTKESWRKIKFWCLGFWGEKIIEFFENIKFFTGFGGLIDSNVNKIVFIGYAS